MTENQENILLFQEAQDDKTTPLRLTMLAKHSVELAAFVSQNPSAPPELLHEFAMSDNWEIQKNVAQNPNTPFHILCFLARRFPDSFLNNPILSLLFIENPGLLQDSVIIQAIARHPNTSPEKLKELTSHQDNMVRLAILENPNISQELLEILHRDPDWWIRMMVAKREDISSNILENLAKDEDKSVRLEVAKNLNTPTNILRELSQEFFRVVSQHPLQPILFLEFPDWAEQIKEELCQINTPVSCFQEIIESWPDLALEISQNPETDKKLLEKLASNNNLLLRENVAGNPNTPTEILINLASAFPDAVLNNPIFPILLLENPIFFDKFSLDTQLIILQNQKIPLHLLQKAASLDKGPFLLALTVNPIMPREILQKLLVNIPHPHYAQAVRLHVNYSGELTENSQKNIENEVKFLYDLNQSEPLYNLEEVIRFYEAATQSCTNNFFEIAETKHLISCLPSSINTSQKAWDHLAKSGTNHVRYLVARCPKTPADLLKYLAQDDDVYIRSAIAGNLSTPRKVLETLSQDQNFMIRNKVFLNYQNRRKRSLSIYWLERYAVAKNPHTPLDILTSLCEDGNRIVRFTAKENLQTQGAAIPS